MNTYTVKCLNCGEEIELNKDLVESEDEIFDECRQCGCPLCIEVEYDDNDNIIALHVY